MQQQENMAPPASEQQGSQPAQTAAEHDPAQHKNAEEKQACEFC